MEAKNRLGELFRSAALEKENLQEVRLRTGNPLLLRYEGREYGLTEKGELTVSPEESVSVTERDLREVLEQVSGYSLYAFDEEMKQGYLTVPGGHRVGVAGKIVMEEGRIQCIRHISFINIRLSHQRKGCADALMPFITEQGELYHTLLISPPGCGKTTMLRDVVRQVSDGFPGFPGKTVGVVDERSEIGGSYRGVPQNDLGIRTDVLDGCQKAEGMMLLLRAMSPQVIAVDEIGGSRDSQAMEAVFHCGCKLLATVHGNSAEDIRQKPLLARIVRGQFFERYVVLGGSGPGQIREIFDGRGTALFRSQ